MRMFSARKRKAAKFRWWQHLIRVAAILVLLGLGAYVSLPVWAPTGLIREYLAEQMSAQMGLAVRIEGLSLSWSDGVELRGLEIASPEGFGPEPMVFVERLCAELAPIDLLFRKRIGWMILEHPKVNVQIDAEGNVNIAALRKLKFDARAQSISVRQADATIRLPNHRKRLRIFVSDAEYLAGRISWLGRVTVSAELDQTGGAAPVSLRLATGNEGVVPANAIFNFANIDLAQLNLHELLGLPVKKLTGHCRGSLDLQLNHEGVVDRFSVDLRIRDLDVQPIAGPEFPVIEEAGLRIAAAYDPITGRFDVQSASVRLPGLDLAGRAVVFAKISEGRWQYVKMLDLQGAIYPERLAAMLTGETKLPHDLQVRGPLRIKLRVDHEKTLYRFEGEIEGTDAEFSRFDRHLKPSGLKLYARISGSLDERGWRLNVHAESTRLSLGRNTLSCGGTIEDVRQLLRPGSTKNPELWPTLLKSLATMDWQGEFEICDLEPFRQLSGPLAEHLKTVRLDGHVAGKWSIRQSSDTSDTEVRLSLEIPSETELTIADLFAKGRHQAVKLDLVGRLGPAGQAFKQIVVDASVGRGRLLLEGTSDPPDPEATGIQSAAFNTHGAFEIVNAEAILECLPLLGANATADVSGTIVGQYRTVVNDTTNRLQLDCDLAKLHIAVGRYFRKPAGQDAQIRLEILSDSRFDADDSVKVTLTGKLPQASVQIWAAGSPRSDANRCTVRVVADIEDSRYLLQASPFLAERFSDGDLSGPLRIEAAGQWDGQTLNGSLRFQADGLALTTGRSVRRTKPAGVPLSGDLTGSYRPQRNNEPALWTIEKGLIEFGRSRLNLAGTIQLESLAERRAEGQGRQAGPGVERSRIEGALSLSLDDALLGAVPELADWAARYGLEGKVEADIKVRADRERISILSRMDAGSLSLDQAGPFSKPADLPARAEMELTLPADLSTVQLNHLKLVVGELSVVADGSADIHRGQDGWPRSPGRWQAHVAVSTTQAQTLQQILPALRAVTISGDLFLEGALTGQAKNWRVSRGSFKAQKLAAHYRGKDVTVGGELRFENLQVGPDGLRELGRLRTDGLEIRAGENHCWLVADLADLPQAAKGRFHVLVDYLDDKDIRDWLVGDGSNSSGPGDSGTDDRSLEAAADGPDADAKAVEIIAMLRNYLGEAHLDGRISMKHLRTYDASVAQTYEARNVEIHASVRDAQVQIAYAAGLNGGTLRNRLEFHLDEAEPIARYETSMRDVIASENIQPQLAKYFPGNTVFGLFNRSEQAIIPLRAIIANAVDSSYPLRPTGEAKTVATDGLLEGRAAPKFVTGIFPGLNFTKYRYGKMTSFATFRPDGVAENDMVFSGRLYDIYIKGTTDTNNIGRYELGMILLGTPQSAEWNHLYRQGRIPIFKIKARIEGGKMHDEEISYFWPNQTLFTVFLENNIFYRMWLASKKADPPISAR